MDNSFLVAKYVPDLERMEPRNIGIVLWSVGKVTTRFSEPSSLPFLEDEENYSRWINYWQELASRNRIQFGSRPAATARTSRFLRELQRAQDGNYVLESGGSIASGIKDIDRAADFLFSRIVSNQSLPDEERATADTLKAVCDDILRTAGLFENSNFIQNIPVPTSSGKQLHFHYGLAANGDAEALLLRVNIGREQSVTSTVGKFASVKNTRASNEGKCISLYEAPEERDNDSRDTVLFLNDWSYPINISSPSAHEKLADRLKAA